MYIATPLLIFLCNNLVYTLAVRQCCHGENVLVNKTCWDGSNLTSLACDETIVIGPIEESPSDIEIDVDDELKVTDEHGMGFYKVTLDKYCVTKLNENGTKMALMCVVIDEVEIEPTTKSNVLFFLKVTCALISTLFLLAVVLIYFFTPSLCDLEGKCFLNCIFIFCLAHFFILFLPFIRYFEPHACNTTAFIFDTTVLCSFNWLSVISFHFWRITIRPIFQTHMSWSTIYFCYGYGVPLVLLTASLILHHWNKTYLDVTEEFDCWVDGSAVVWGYFYGPLFVMITISTVLQLWAAHKIWYSISRHDHSQPDVLRLRKKSTVYLHLLFVMGVTQIIDTVVYPLINKNEVLDYILDVNDCKNLLLGIVIFLILVAFRKKVLKELGKRGLFCIKFPKQWEKLIDEETETMECEETPLARDSSSL